MKIDSRVNVAWIIWTGSHMQKSCIECGKRNNAIGFCYYFNYFLISRLIFLQNMKKCINYCYYHKNRGCTVVMFLTPRCFQLYECWTYPIFYIPYILWLLFLMSVFSIHKDIDFIVCMQYERSKMYISWGRFCPNRKLLEW